MKIAFFGYYVPAEDLASTPGVSMADNKMQHDYITALEKSLGQPVAVFSTESINYVNIKGLRTPSKMISGAVSIIRWAREVKRQGDTPALFYYNTFFLNVAAATLARIFCRFYLVPIAITLPYLAEGEHRPLPRMAERVCALALKKSDGIVAITEELAERLCPGKPRLVIHGGISPAQLEEWSIVGDDPQIVPRVDALIDPPQVNQDTNKKKTIVYTGAIYSRYNLDKVIAAADLLGGEKYEVVLYGRGPDLDIIKERCASSKAARYGGFVTGDELRRVQRGADVLLAVLSADDRLARYTFPSKLFEYMAAGNPVVTSDLPSLPESLRRQVQVAAAITPEGIRDAIVAACGLDHRERELHRAACREYLEQNATWDRHAERLAEFLKELEIKKPEKNGKRKQ